MISDDESLAATTAELERIRRLTYEYAFAVDRFEIDRLTQLWLPDGEFDERPIGGTLLEGRDAIKEKFEYEFRERDASGHFITNHAIDVTGPWNASGLCYALVHADLASGQSFRACVQYADRYRHDGQSWRFESRVVSMLKPLESN